MLLATLYASRQSQPDNKFARMLLKHIMHIASRLLHSLHFQTARLLSNANSIIGFCDAFRRGRGVPRVKIGSMILPVRVGHPPPLITPVSPENNRHTGSRVRGKRRDYFSKKRPFRSCLGYCQRGTCVVFCQDLRKL